MLFLSLHVSSRVQAIVFVLLSPELCVWYRGYSWGQNRCTCLDRERLGDTLLLDCHPLYLTFGSLLNLHVPRRLNVSCHSIIYQLEGMNFKDLSESKLWQEDRRETLGGWTPVGGGPGKRARFMVFILLLWNSSHGNISLPSSTHMISNGACSYLAAWL